MYFLNNTRIIQNISGILLLELPLVKNIIFLFYGHTSFSTKNCIIKLTLFFLPYYWLQMTFDCFQRSNNLKGWISLFKKIMSEMFFTQKDYVTEMF